MAALPVLDDDDPEVGVEGKLAGEVAIGFRLGCERRRQTGLPTPFVVRGAETGRSRPKQVALPSSRLILT